METNTPQRGDIVVRKEWREGVIVYALRTVPGPEQLIIQTYDGAVAQAFAFATLQWVCVFVEVDGNFELLRDFGVPASVQRAVL